MEEKKQQKKLTYEELNRVAGELHANYQKLAAEYQKLVAKHQEALAALNNREFEYMSNYVMMLFKVMDHPEMYSKEFVEWVAGQIEGALTSFATSLLEKKEDVKADESAEKKGTEETNEAE